MWQRPGDVWENNPDGGGEALHQLPGPCWALLGLFGWSFYGDFMVILWWSYGGFYGGFMEIPSGER